MQTTRRQFLQSAGAAGGALALGSCGWRPPRLFAGSAAAAAGTVRHRSHRRRDDGEPSFDHMLGWLAGRRRQAGRPDVPRSQRARRTAPIRWRPISRAAAIRTPITPTRADASSTTAAPAMAGCGRRQRRVRDRLLHEAGSAVLRPGATRALDRRATAISRRSWRPTFPNRIYQHAAQTDRLENTFDALDAADDLGSARRRRARAAATTSAMCRSSRCGVPSTSRSPPFTQFLIDCATGTLPAVSFVEPRFLGEEVGARTTIIRIADIRNGQAFMNLVTPL